MEAMDPVTINGRQYSHPGCPVVVVCMDGCAPEYLDAVDGGLPYLDRLRGGDGAFALVPGNMPSYTNPNNVSMVTGVRPDVHGISGNHFLDEHGDEVPMIDPAQLRCPTLLAALSDAGLRVCCVTAKEKLRRLVGSGLSGPSLSGERAAEAAAGDPGVRALVEAAGDPPGIYSGRLSAHVLDLGLAMLRGAAPPQVLYLSLTDYVPHKHAPGTAEANRFFQSLDRRLAQMDALGVVLGVCADHGMNPKTDADGAPNVVYLEQVLAPLSAPSSALRAPRSYQVVLPITDPYVAHHGALGSFACVYVTGGGADLQRAADLLAAQQGIEAVLSRDQAAADLHLPQGRIGDLVVLGDRTTVLGKSPEHHDLSELDRPLRSHGGLHERTVPLLVNRPLPAGSLDGAGSHDVFHLVLNV